MLNNSSILITGGTGSFGNAFIPMTLEKFNPRRIIIFSRDEMKQWEMANLFKGDSRIYQNSIAAKIWMCFNLECFFLNQDNK